jgi:hypothetical protein
MYFLVFNLHCRKVCAGFIDHCFGKVNSEDSAVRSNEA